jgi:inner membrane protein
LFLRRDLHDETAASPQHRQDAQDADATIQSNAYNAAMDTVTHIVLGGVIAPAAFGKKLGRIGIAVGMIAANLPDLDVYFKTGNAINDELVHRSFMHSLLFMPLLGFAAALPFLLIKRMRPMWRELWIVGILGVLSHLLLDTCTSYGTELLWPYRERFTWDLIAVVDPAFTIPLLIGVAISLRRPNPKWARIALAVALAYIGLAAIQHQRGLSVQREIIAHRGDSATNARVLPLIGTINGYRSIYRNGDEICCDAIRVPFFGRGLVRDGERIERASPGDFEIAAGSIAAADFKRFDRFANGFIARHAEKRDVVGDMRYSSAADKFRPYWGIRIDAGTPVWTNLRDENPRSFRAIWRDMIGRGDWYRVEQLPL